MTPDPSGTLPRMPAPATPHRLSIVLPAKNEEPSLGSVVTTLRQQHPDAEVPPAA